MNTAKIQKNIEKEARNTFAKNFHSMHFVDGEFLENSVTLFARVKCTACSLYGRAILCPPLLAQTYPQFATIDSSRKFYHNKIKTAAVFVFKNDGTLPWKRNEEELANIEFKKRYARQLKGVENGSAKAINKYMRAIEQRMKKEYDLKAQALIAGHCDICPSGARCPNRENPPCKRKGMTSMEATGLDVYLVLDRLSISYEYPAISYLTQCTTLLILK